MRAALHAERLKLRHTGVAWSPFVGLFIGLLQGGLFMLSPEAVPSWRGLTAWHTLWITFMAPLTLALVAGLTSLREARARGGGTWWRATAPLTLHLAEFAGLAVLALFTSSLVMLSSLPLGGVLQLSGAPPVGRLLTLTLTLWLASLPILAIYQAIARSVGLIGSLFVGFGGTVSGVLIAEGPNGWINPWAWPVRATLKLSGTHANGVPLEPDSVLWQLPVWHVLVLAALVTPAVLLLSARIPRERRVFFRSYRQNAAPISVRPYRRSPLASELVKHRHTVLPWLTFIMPCLVALGAKWRDAPLGAWQVWALLILPFGAALLPSVAWLWEAEAWRALRTRPVSAAQLYTTKLTALWLHANTSVLILAIPLSAFGVDWDTLSRLFILHLSVSFCLLAFHLLLAARYGAGVSLGTGIVMTLLAVILGGTGLGAVVWPFFPWVWGWIPAFGVSTVPFVTVAVVLGLLFTWMGSRVVARFAQ